MLKNKKFTSKKIHKYRIMKLKYKLWNKTGDIKCKETYKSAKRDFKFFTKKSNILFETNLRNKS